MLARTQSESDKVKVGKAGRKYLTIMMTECIRVRQLVFTIKQQNHRRLTLN